MTGNDSILICFDGSDAAKEAVLHAAQLFPGRSAVVLHVWKPIESVGFSYVGMLGDIGAIDASLETDSTDIAEAGMRIADAAGLRARAETLRTLDTVGHAIIERCERGDCVAVVVGTVGHSGLGGSLLGSVSNHLVHDAPIPVVVVKPVSMREGERSGASAGVAVPV